MTVGMIGISLAVTVGAVRLAAWAVNGEGDHEEFSAQKSPCCVMLNRLEASPVLAHYSRPPKLTETTVFTSVCNRWRSHKSNARRFSGRYSYRS